MKQSITQIYESTFRRFVLSVLYLVTTTLIISGLLYSLQKPFIYFFIIICALNIISIVIVHTIPVNYIKKLVKAYFILMVILLFPSTILYLSMGIASTLYWYLAIPVYLYVVYPDKKGFIMIVLLFVLMLLSFALAFVMRDFLYDNMSVSFGSMPLIFALRSDMINGGAAFVMIFISLYYMHKFNQLRINQLLDSVEGTYQEGMDDLLYINSDEEYKYGQIYIQIEEYFKNKQPYLDADFKMAKMAHELNINIAYLAKAIRLKKNMNFNNFVNDYRIEKVKELMQNDSRKYTLKYIYLSSGFKYQSSFNKAFKLKEGVNPSDYYKLKKDGEK